MFQTHETHALMNQEINVHTAFRTGIFRAFFVCLISYALFIPAPAIQFQPLYSLWIFNGSALRSLRAATVAAARLPFRIRAQLRDAGVIQTRSGQYACEWRILYSLITETAKHENEASNAISKNEKIAKSPNGNK